MFPGRRLRFPLIKRETMTRSSPLISYKSPSAVHHDRFISQTDKHTFCLVPRLMTCYAKFLFPSKTKNYMEYGVSSSRPQRNEHHLMNIHSNIIFYKFRHTHRRKDGSDFRTSTADAGGKNNVTCRRENPYWLRVWRAMSTFILMTIKIYSRFVRLSARNVVKAF